MSSNPYDQNPAQPGGYQAYTQGYTPGSYGQQPPAPTHGSGYPAEPTYGAPYTSYGAPYTQPTYEQPVYDAYGQPTYGAPGYGQMGLAPYTAVGGPARPSVSMTEAMKLWAKNWKNFSGRASRGEYWWAALGLGIAGAVLGIIWTILFVVVAATTPDSSTAANLMLLALMGILGVVSLVTFIPSLSLAVRRLHDTNQSGWMYLMTFIPYVGSIILLVLLAQPSNALGARFDDPRQPLAGPEHL